MGGSGKVEEALWLQETKVSGLGIIQGRLSTSSSLPADWKEVKNTALKSAGKNWRGLLLTGSEERN